MNTTKYPVTVRDAGDMAEKLGITFVELLEMLGPIPMPPAGYTLARGSDNRWIGTETIRLGWIITPVWTWSSSGGAHSLELWMADHKQPTYSNLSPADALQLAADLAAAAKAIAATEAKED
jgi:hypothetical protein